MSPEEADKRFFTRQLIKWHQHQNDRSLPWKEEKDPYKIWLSEIILQQTRAEQGLPYYLKFIKKYPTIQKLARANDKEVYRLWQGLGYYNRCRNLLFTARHVVNELKGNFPSEYDELIKLKGVGSYTAAAIASFAFNKPHAVVDGNVHRLLSRFFGIEISFSNTNEKKIYQQLADELMDRSSPAIFNQAIMDYGATVCTPALPKCADCVFSKKCFAYQQDMVAALPVKNRKQEPKARYFHYIFITSDKKLWLRPRKGKDIWQNLYEPFLIEHDSEMSIKQLMAHPSFSAPFGNKKPEFLASSSQRLTHQLIKTNFFYLEINDRERLQEYGGVWTSRSSLKKYALPKTLVSFLENNFYF